MRIDWKDYRQKKIIQPDKLAIKVAELKNKGLSIVTLNGSFDLMHSGHLHILFSASQQADILLVALNTDKSIQAYKNPNRPIISLEYRLDMIIAMTCVDYVTWFDETDPRQILTIIKPDVHVNGVEYGDQCIEAETVRTLGGRLHLVDRVPGLATSQVVTKIMELENKG